MSEHVYQEFISCIGMVHCGFATVVGKSEEKNSAVKGFSVQLNAVWVKKKCYLETKLSRVHLICAANEISKAK